MKFETVVIVTIMRLLKEVSCNYHAHIFLAHQYTRLHPLLVVY